MTAYLSSEGRLVDYRVPDYRYYPTSMIPMGTRDWSRVRLLQACERLKVPLNRWPQFAETLDLPADAHNYVGATAFTPPPFDILRDSATGWREHAERLFQQHCAAFLKGVSHTLDDLVAKGVLSKIEQSREGAGPLPLRFEWAARRYCYNEPYKDIATAKYGPEKIRKAVSRIFIDTGIRSSRKRK